MIRIGEFSKLAKTTVKTLRFYDEIDLFKPEFVDDNGYRYYSIDQLNVLQKIVALRKLDMPLDDIKSVLNGDNLLNVLDKRLSELEDELETNQMNISLIKNYIKRSKRGDFMNNYQAKEVVLKERIVYYRHGVIDSMADITDFVLKAGEEAKANNSTLKCSEDGYCFVTYTAKEYKERDVELEYAEAVEAFGKESENIKFKKLKETKAISVMHVGAYDALDTCYAYALGYVKSHKLEIDGPIREVYIDGCWNKDNPKDYLTEIQIPIK